jgi:hypothetical protein
MNYATLRYKKWYKMPRKFFNLIRRGLFDNKIIYT